MDGTLRLIILDNQLSILIMHASFDKETSISAESQFGLDYCFCAINFVVTSNCLLYLFVSNVLKLGQHCGPRSRRFVAAFNTQDRSGRLLRCFD